MFRPTGRKGTPTTHRSRAISFTIAGDTGRESKRKRYFQVSQRGRESKSSPIYPKLCDEEKRNSSTLWPCGKVNVVAVLLLSWQGGERGGRRGKRVVYFHSNLFQRGGRFISITGKEKGEESPPSHILGVSKKRPADWIFFSSMNRRETRGLCLPDRHRGDSSISQKKGGKKKE